MTAAHKKHNVDDASVTKWQQTVDLMAELFAVPSALIMRVWSKEIEVLVASNSKNNPYTPGAKEALGHGLYCETVMKNHSLLHVENALLDDKWKNNPDIKFNMIAYLGIPIIAPDNQIFGTICVLDNKANQFSESYQKLLWQFKTIIEQDLHISNQNKQLKESNTRCHKVMQEIRESREHFQDLIQNIQEVFWIGTPDWSEVLYVSPGYEKIWGKSCFSLYEQPLSWLDSLPEEDRNKVLAFLEERAGDDLTDMVFPEYRVIQKNGSTKWVSARAVPIHNDSGKVVRVAGIAEDITERKKAEEVLRRYEQIVSASGDHMSFIDQNYVYQAVNDTYLNVHQKTLQEIIGHSVADLLGIDVFEQFVKKKLNRCLAGETIQYQAWFEFQEIGQRYMDVLYNPFRDINNEVTGVVVSARDITKLEQAEQALRESNIALKVMVEQQQCSKEDMEQQILAKLKKFVFPYLDLLNGSAKNAQEQESLAIIRGHLSSITDSFTRKLSDPLLNLSQRELLVADLVRQGRSTQEIADLLSLSLRTIEAYRMQLRKKLGLKTKKENLRKYLLGDFVKE